MAWNEPGKDEKNPWGNRGNDGPPDLDDVIRNIQRKLQGLFGGGSSTNDDDSSGSGNTIGAGILLAVVAVVWLASGIYIVDPPERGVVLQFGKYKETTLSGPHWHIPFPIQKVEVVNVDESRTAEIGFRSTAGRLSLIHI